MRVDSAAGALQHFDADVLSGRIADEFSLTKHILLMNADEFSPIADEFSLTKHILLMNADEFSPIADEF
ncbi:hypothetical protein NL676_030169 [Syzygium grande]|nr:hypothetical protein NL676_030169 [Syzygium grande]